MDLYIDLLRLFLLYDCLKSERSVVRMCAELSADDEDVARLWNEFIFYFKWSSKIEIKELCCKNVLIMRDGNGDDYMCTYCSLLTCFLSYAYTFRILDLLLWRK